jgi:NADPH-dependent 2,4-dienoyl-CoA reductase/sulfur reductase-like enzyme
VRDDSCDVAIIGAGPYGLAAACELREQNGFRVVGFGEPMSFWATQMPKGMLLRSPYAASDIGDPKGDFSLAAYERSISAEPEAPVPLSRFVDYGRWVQRTVLPDLRNVRVTAISQNGSGFKLALASGGTVKAERVVIAAGIADFASRPAVFDGLGPTLVSHAADHDDLGVFCGSKVLVVGGGQSALESAALLAENGATVEVTVRAPTVRWLTRRWHHQLGPISSLLYAPPEVGPAGISWFVALPRLYRSMPRGVQDWMTVKALRPAGAGWLPPRLSDVPIIVGISAIAATEVNSHVSVMFDDGTAREADHVLLGTGYRVDVAKYPFLAPELVEELQTVDGYPVLSRGFESNVPGLHFLGAPAAWSFGPLMRFVAGTGFAAAELARAVAGRSTAPR